MDCSQARTLKDGPGRVLLCVRAGIGDIGQMQSAQAENPTEPHPAQIRRLDPTVVNRIAAGEVIERPASVIKELVENALDAGASRIEVVTARGGKTLLRVSDNGSGMDKANLLLAVERHCTSKLGQDFMDIRHLGFRGEALPSIGSVARLTITSRAAGSPDAWRIKVEGGRMTPPAPAALSSGTVVEVSDLFFATPARLKFLKSDQAEANAVTDMFKRIALAFPNVHFSISGADRSSLDFPVTDRQGRISQVLGRDFNENCVEIDAVREGVTLTGLASKPTWHRGNAMAQYFFVNGRPVRDKALIGAVRGAYMDFVPRGRHPALALYLELDPRLVDVNVHPAKAEVRFRDPGLVRGLVVGALKQALSEQGPLSDRAGSVAMAEAFRPATFAEPRPQPGWQAPLSSTVDQSGFMQEQEGYVLDTQPSGSVGGSLESSYPSELRKNPNVTLVLPPEPIVEQPEDPMLIELLEKMRSERLYADHDLRVGGLAERFGIPEYQLRKKINQELGYRNFNQFVNKYRIDEAGELLTGDPRTPVLTIALEVGFRSISSFNTAFQAAFGMSATAYRAAGGAIANEAA